MLDIERYSRQLVLPGWSLATQAALAAQTLVLESEFQAAAAYALAAGVGRLQLYAPVEQESSQWLGAINPAAQVQLSGDRARVSLSDAVSIVSEALSRELSLSTEHYFIAEDSLQYSLPQQQLPQRLLCIDDCPRGITADRWRQFAASIAVADYLNRFASLQLQVT